MVKKVDFAQLEAVACSFATWGAELALDEIGSTEMWAQRLGYVKTKEQRAFMRYGYTQQMIAIGAKDLKHPWKLATESALDKRFEREAKKHCPDTSRKARDNAKKAEAKAAAAKAAKAAVEKAGAQGAVMSEKDMAKALMAATLYIAEAQTKPPVDFLAWSGQLLAIITPKAVKSKKSKTAPVEILDADIDE